MPAADLPRPAPALGSKSAQRGTSLIEALVAVMVFSFGVVGMAGLQAHLFGAAVQSQYRAQASHLSEELLGLAAADPGNATCYTMDATGPGVCSSTSAGTAVVDWRARALQSLPGATQRPPTVTYAADGTMTITLLWNRPQETVQHNYVATTNLYPGF
jgi:type IV pilus assembly protein PilV